MTSRRNSVWVAGGLTTLFAVGSLGCASLQEEENESGPSVITEDSEATGTVRGDLPRGARFDVQLENELSTDKSRTGDSWRAVVASDVTDGSDVLLTRGAVVSGVVTRVGEVEVEGETRQVIALEPQKLHLHAGEEVDIDAEVVDADVDRKRDTFSRESIAIIGGGALGGAILGEILADEALLGAILGGAGGTVVAIATADTKIELPEGSRLTLRLEEPVRVARANRDR